MNKLFRRFIAYIIDMMVILIATESLSSVPYINRQLDNYNKYYQDYLVNYNNYVSFKNDISYNFKDEELSKDEYDSLVDNHDNYVDVLLKYYIDNGLSKDNYDKLNEEIDKEFNNINLDYYYKLEKNSICYLIIYLVMVLTT